MQDAIEPGAKIGEIMVRQGTLTSFQVEALLYLQAGTDKRIGEIMVEIGVATPLQVERALLEQRQSNHWLF